MHPFIEAMNFILADNNEKPSRPKIVQSLMLKTNAEVARCREVLKETARGIIEQRKRSKPKDDMLNTMIYGKDPKTGQVMRDELIIAQMVNFLIAGHETTSGMLSFATMYLLKNPHTYLKAQKEVDEIVGKGPIESHHINKLRYINAVLRETSRLSPTAPALQKSINPAIPGPALLGGKYTIVPTDIIVTLISKCQRDPKIWGETAEEFEPDRMLDENFDKITAQYPGAWKVSLPVLVITPLTP
jgi:cytochrome P450 / NADPH-cytochrome P450 reductase